MSLNPLTSSWVETTLARMTLAEQIGQMLMADFPAVFTSREHENWRRIQSLIREQHLGGIILAGGSIFDIAVLTNELQQSSKMPLLVNADLETGVTFWHPWRRARGRAPDLPDELTGGGTLLPRFMALGATRNEDYAFQAGRIAAQESRAIGIHWTNSPLVDINTHPENPIINVRAFSDDPALVARLGAAYVKGCQSAGVIATLKHFPGHGDTAEDTHTRLPEIFLERARLHERELVPFRAGLAAGAKAVMTAHLAFPQIDSSRKPATLSPLLLTNLLREELGHEGLIVTDALTMQGITNHFAPEEAVLLAAQAGADMLLIPVDMVRAHKCLMAAVHNGELPAAQVRASVRRILTAKFGLGLHERRQVEIEKIRAAVNTPAAQQLAEKIAEAAITLLEHEGRMLPLNCENAANMLALIISNTADPAEGEHLTNALTAKGHRVEIVRWNEEYAFALRERLTAQLQSCDLVLLAIYFTVGAWKGPMRLPEAMPQLLRQIHEQRKRAIAISFGDPYVFAKLPKMPVSVCAYGGGRLMERAVAQVLLGEVPIHGKLPVTISEGYRFGAGLTFRNL